MQIFNIIIELKITILSLFYKDKCQYKSTSGSVRVGAQTTSTTYTVKSNIAGTFTYTVNGTPKYVTLNKSSDTASANTEYTVTVTGGSNGEGSNTISNKFTPSTSNNYSTNYNEKTVNYTASTVPTYTVSYNANGGSGAPSSQIKVKGTNLTLSSTVPTKNGGYTFLGWSTSNTATSATYSAGGSYTANSGATLYAVWKDSQPPSLAINKWTYHEETKWESISSSNPWQIANAYPSGDTLVLYNQGDALASPRLPYSVNGGLWYIEYDAYPTVASPIFSPKGGVRGNFSYTDIYINELTSGNGYISNGWSNGDMPLNTWTHAVNTTGLYATGVDSVYMTVHTDNYYSTGPCYFKNLKFWGNRMYSSFYYITITSSDNVGVTETRVINGSQTVANCLSNGTVVNTSNTASLTYPENSRGYKVTSNGTYTVCVKDAAGNQTKQEIVIDRISKLTPTYPKLNNSDWIPEYISELFYTFDGYNYQYLKRGNAHAYDGGNYTDYSEIRNNPDAITLYAGTNITPTPYGVPSLTGDRGLIVAGTNTYDLASSISNNWISIVFYGAYGSGYQTISNFKLKFSNGNSLTINQAVDAGYISPFVVTFSYGAGDNETYYMGPHRTFNSGGSITGHYPVYLVFIKVNSVYALTGINFTSANAWDNRADGLIIDKYVSTFDFSMGPFNAKYWVDWSNTLMPMGSTPSVTYSSPSGTNHPLSIITTEAGRHEACLSYGENIMCLRPNYWTTDAVTTGDKMKNDLIKAFGATVGNSFSCSGTSTQAKCSYGNSFFYAYSDGSVRTFYQQSPSNVWCQVNADGQAHCGS